MSCCPIPKRPQSHTFEAWRWRQLEGCMELRHLRYFIAIAEHGTVTGAAKAVLVAQPSLSRQLNRLETELGVTLFHHGVGRLRLTPAGIEFLAMARDLVSRADSAIAAAAALATGSVARLTIAAPVT